MEKVLILIDYPFSYYIKNMISELLNVDLIKELGLDELPPNKKEALLAQMMETLESRLGSEIFPLLSERDIEELEKVSESKGDVEAFIKEKVPNVELIAAEVVAQFKKEMLELNAAVEEARKQE